MATLRQALLGVAAKCSGLSGRTLRKVQSALCQKPPQTVHRSCTSRLPTVRNLKTERNVNG